MFCEEMTYSSDALAAFSGILATLEPAYGTRVFHGLPEEALLLGLYWIPGYSAGVCTGDTSDERRHGFPSRSWAGRNGPIEGLEAVVLPDWWQWEGKITPHASTRARISCHAVVSPMNGLSVKRSTGFMSPARMMDPGDGLSTPWIKIFDTKGRWCGRLCDGYTNGFTEIDMDHSDLLLLSTCGARHVTVKEGLGSAS